MLKLRPAYIRKSGRKQFAVLTIEDYERVKEALEDAEDLRLLREARKRNGNSPGISPKELKRRPGPGRKGRGASK